MPWLRISISTFSSFAANSDSDPTCHLIVLTGKFSPFVVIKISFSEEVRAITFAPLACNCSSKPRPKLPEAPVIAIVLPLRDRAVPISLSTNVNVPL